MANQPKEFHVRCADLGDPNCKWEGRAKTEEELMRSVELHAREAHNFPRLGSELYERVRSKMKAA